MEEEQEPLAENFFIIFLAYVAAFLPWTAVSSTDFISPSWKSVRATRRAGVTNLLLAAIPALYIIFYIILQASADFKEMFAAVVAFLFSLLHIIRTCWGLWQLHIFKRWAAHAIRALAHLGITYTPRKLKYKTPEVIAEHLLVNDDLIDNQLFHGHARCYIHYDGVDFKTDPLARTGVLYQRLALLPRLFLLSLRYFINYFRTIIFRRTAPPLQQLPHRPIDVWLRWSVAFAAQGLSSWISDFTVARDPDIKKHSSNMVLYEERRAYFAGQVLAGAGMQLWPDGEFPLIETGHVSKMDLFWPAVFSGTGLPFGAPQTDVLQEAVGDTGDLPRSAYRPYARKLAKVIEGMPVMFGKEIEEFDVERLEWLTILLYLGTQIMEQGGELDESVESYSSYSTGETTSTTSVATGFSEEFTEEVEDELEDGDLALDNLRIQLGFGTEDKAPTDPDKGIASFSAVPLPSSSFHDLSDGNRLVTKVGELIDCWLALVAGDQIHFLLNMDEKWAQKCLAGPVLDLSVVVHRPALKSRHRVQRTNELLRSTHLRLEKARLAYQFAVKRHPYWHMEQTLTFMGHTLEGVRTCLARRALETEELPPGAWEPEVFSEGELETTWTNFGLVSPALSKGIARAPDKRYFDQRAVQIRILWELQVLLRDQLYIGAASPSSVRAVILCILGFPSVAIEVTTVDDDSECLDRTVPAHQGKNALSLFLGLCCSARKKNSESDGPMTWMFNITPICGPQDIGICAKFVPFDEKSYLLDMRLFRGSSLRDANFEWECWRDSSMSRMDGLRQWQKAHKMRSLDLYPTNASISEGVREQQVILKGTGKSFITWSGWEPFRFEQCRFELESPEFLLHFESSKVVNFTTGEDQDDARRHRLPRAERIVLPYEKSEREQLRHGCFVIREVIPEEGKDEDEGMNETLSRTQRAKRLIAEADTLYEQGPENFDRSVLLLEVAAVELDSIDALEKCVVRLTHPTTTTKDPKRAARLIENCLASQLKKKHGNYARLTQAHEDYGSAAFHSLFAELVVRGGFSKETVVPFSNYLGVVISVDQDSSIARCFCWFRRMFMYSRRYEILEVLATTMRSTRVSVSCDADIDLSDDECRHYDGFATMGFVDDNRRKSINVLSKAFYERAVADGQHLSSMNELGLLLQQGAEGVEKDTERARNLFQYAIEHKSVYAMNNLGSLLLHGAEGITRDPVQAKSLFERAIKKGKLVGAIYNLAILLRDGAEGVEKDPVAAMELFKWAIREGHHVKAMYNLGLMFEHGDEGVEKSAVLAMELYDMAVAEGEDEEARERLTLLLGLRNIKRRDSIREGKLSHLLESPPV